MTMRHGFRQALRWSVAALVVAGSLRLLLDVATSGPDPESVPFAAWYGNWQEVVLVSAVAVGFVLGFLRPRRTREWRNAGVYTAFLVSLFTEMFGVPLTVYLVAPLLGLTPTVFGRDESLLWAFTLDRLGLLSLPRGAYAAMVLSVGLIATGASLLAVGWATLHRGQGALVTSGIYRHVRHPQYLGLVLIVAAYVIEWPTLPGLVMAPVLIVLYPRLAIREDDELTARFGTAHVAYARETPAFVPWRRGQRPQRGGSARPSTAREETLA